MLLAIPCAPLLRGVDAQAHDVKTCADQDGQQAFVSPPDLQRMLERCCQIGKKFRQPMPQRLGNEQRAPDHWNIEKQDQDNVPGPGALFQETHLQAKHRGLSRWIRLLSPPIYGVMITHGTCCCLA